MKSMRIISVINQLKMTKNRTTLFDFDVFIEKAVKVSDHVNNEAE